MRTSSLMGIVLVLHGVALGCILMMQGCGTTKASAARTQEPGVSPPGTTQRPPLFPPPAPGTTPAQAEPAKTTTYMVAKGDTLSLIAQKFKLSVSEIKALNKDTIGDSNKLREGQKLLLPGTVDVSSQAAPKRTAAPATRPKGDAARTVEPAGAVAGNVYVVKAGDALSKIAKAHNTSVEAIRRANGLKGDAIRVGQKLTLPTAGAPRNEPAASTPAPTSRKTQPAASAAASLLATGAAEPAAARKGGAGQEEEKTVQAETGTAPAGRVESHTVQPGETLDDVAMHWTVSKTAIRKLNNLPDDTIQPGQVLKIPITEP